MSSYSEKKERSETTPLSSVNEEMQTAETTPNVSNAVQSHEPEFDLKGTVLNDYS
ncbi:hypothetical protein [Cytobacillus oceanisediminis]|uniref:Uncharacterized protein n=1 Tax=Cytobacillus oceanisediminis TaxID=665099 RepID=A0A562K593_9BACI|nr:hypothetical protein [Cytobacillus oceanisediminis]TWH90608.1 hypothetical protein IQ19_00051 [Cytobacillus oceanisediminis]